MPKAQSLSLKEEVHIADRHFIANIQQALMVARLQGTQFNGHSFRIGAASM